MQRIRRLWTGTGILAIGIIVAWVFYDSHGSRQRFESIQIGMTIEQVNDILGGPAGDYAVEPHFILVGIDHVSRYRDGRQVHIWLFDGGCVDIEFDASGQVHSKSWRDMPRQSFWERLRSWIR